jgi:hypothetical protein
MARLSPYELGNVAAFVYEAAKGLTGRVVESTAEVSQPRLAAGQWSRRGGMTQSLRLRTGLLDSSNGTSTPPSNWDGRMGDANEEEYASLLQVIRQRARESGRSDLDASLFRSRLQDTASNKDAVLAYLYGVRDEAALRDERTLRSTMGRLAEFLTDDGGFVSGIVVDTNEQDRVVFDGRTQLDLLEFSEAKLSGLTGGPQRRETGVRVGSRLRPRAALSPSCMWRRRRGKLPREQPRPARRSSASGWLRPSAP